MTISGALCLVMALGSLAFGERVSFDTRAAWQEWAHPVGAVDLQATGRIQPVPVRKNINAVRNAERFGGGIRRVGSNASDARFIMDGDPTYPTPRFERGCAAWMPSGVVRYYPMA